MYDKYILKIDNSTKCYPHTKVYEIRVSPCAPGVASRVRRSPAALSVCPRRPAQIVRVNSIFDKRAKDDLLAALQAHRAAAPVLQRRHRRRRAELSAAESDSI